MSYQCWFNVQLVRSGLTKYRKFHTSHVNEGLAREYMVNMWRSICSKKTNSLCKTEELIHVLEVYNHQILYPALPGREHCTLLLLLNLAQPQWVSVDCNNKLINHVVCFSPKQNIYEKKEVPNQQKLLICTKTAILYKKWCYFFFQCGKCSGKNVLSACRNKGFRNILKDDSLALELFSIIAEVYGKIGFNFAVINKKGKLSYLIGEKYRTRLLSPFSYRKVSVKGQNYAFLSCKENMIKQNIYKGLVYKHDNGHYSSVMSLYDGKQWHMNVKCNTVFFYKSINGNCNSFSQQEIFEYTLDRKTNLNGLVSDQAGDEPTYRALLLEVKFYQCPLHHLPCNYGNSKCYYFNEICIFRLNKYLNIIPCRTGSHLESCQNFECNIHFKCPGYYCIPWGYVCDGKWDCPDGYDESDKIGCGQKRLCTSMFHCKESQICLHLENICDGYDDCPLGDDEFLCVLKKEHCLEKCTCQQLAIMCTKRKIHYSRLGQMPHIFYHLTFLDQLVLFVLENSHAIIVNLTHNSITDVCSRQYRYTRLLLLELSHNNIIKLSSKCFSDSNNLRKVIVRNNSMSKSEPKTFINLKRLFWVDISSNKLESLSKRFFVNVPNLYIFIIYDNPLNQLQHDIFMGIIIKIIHSKMMVVCCINKVDLICTETKDWFSSCNSLLPNVSVKVSFIIISLLILSTNMLSFLQVRKSTVIGRPYLIIVSAVCFTNMSLALYFILHWFIDMSYGDTFVLIISKWKNSATCAFLFSLFLSFKFLQPFLLSLLSLARFMVVKYPFVSKFKSTRFTLKILMLGFSLICLFSIISGVMVTFQGGSPDILCLPFADPTKNSKFIQVIIYLASAIQIFTIFATSTMYFLMLTSIQKSENNIRSDTRSHSTSVVLRQIIILSLSKVICWLSSSVIFITAFVMDKYPLLMIYWTIILIVPINAIAIPIVLSLTALKKKV